MYRANGVHAIQVKAAVLSTARRSSVNLVDRASSLYASHDSFNFKSASNSCPKRATNGTERIYVHKCRDIFSYQVAASILLSSLHPRGGVTTEHLFASCDAPDGSCPLVRCNEQGSVSICIAIDSLDDVNIHLARKDCSVCL